ncbi:ABC transporter ATP-binding protein/permease [Nocardia sp. NPDC023852]|uniref:ABC transporter ATP-binding protein/permease n=1 Tax=Nocardia sp. NPDC023852 TaxID=3154697 RepID=UPI0033FCA52F
METSKDWAVEFQQTLKWLLIACSITAVVFVVIAAAVFLSTKWGRQFWRLVGTFFVGKDAFRTMLFVAGMLFSTVLAVRMTVLLSYQSNDMFSALQAAAEAFTSGDAHTLAAAERKFWNSMTVFAILATLHVVRSLVDFYIGQAFDIRWRRWLTERVTTDWLHERAHYRGRFIDNTIDNPDQRVQEDITTFVQQSRVLSMGGVSAVVSVVSFTQILWDLSGPLTIVHTEVPRAMVFLVLIYVLVATTIAFWIGRPLIRLNFLYQRATANFRYILVRLRDNSENVAFYRGEETERGGILGRFATVLSTYWGVVYRSLKFQGWNLGVDQGAVVFPWILQAPRFFQGSITLGGIQQSATAFGEIHASLSFFRESYDQFAAYRASLIRLDGLMAASDASRRLPKVDTAALDAALELVGIDVRRPDGEVLIDDLNLRLSPGDALVVKGRSGSGKTTLLRTLAEMWPYGDGLIRRPPGKGSLFASQLPYLPLGDLHAAVCYPADSSSIPEQRIRELLDKVHLGHLVDRLDEETDWATILSPGEQQRIAFARILLLEPELVFLDEATSAVDEGLEYSLYRLIRTEAPNTILVSVAHRSTVNQFHTQRLELDGNGSWRMEGIPATPSTICHL